MTQYRIVTEDGEYRREGPWHNDWDTVERSALAVARWNSGRDVKVSIQRRYVSFGPPRFCVWSPETPEAPAEPTTEELSPTKPLKDPSPLETLGVARPANASGWKELGTLGSLGSPETAAQRLPIIAKELDSSALLRVRDLAIVLGRFSIVDELDRELAQRCS